MQEMDGEESRRVLDENRFGHVGLADGGRAYVIPVFYGYDGQNVYFQSHQGLKTDYLEATVEGCLTVTSAESEDVWRSVQVLGPVEALQFAPDTEKAMAALLSLPAPPELGRSDFGEPLRTDEGTFFWKLVPKHVSGRKSVRPAPVDDISTA